MKEKLSTGDIIDRLARQSGITKKLAAEVIRAIPEVIEEGLLSDGEAKVRGLGTFRLKTVAAKKGRNPLTGEEVIIPPHDKLVFLPEESFRDELNEPYKYLGIRVIEEEVGSQRSAVSGQQSAVSSQRSAVGGQQSTVGSQQSAVSSLEPEGVVSRQSAVGDQEPVGGQQSAVGGQQSTVGSQQSAVSSPEPGTSGTIGTSGTQNSEFKTQNSKFKTNYWLIPVVIVIVAALSIVFYWRNFYPGQQSAVRSSQSAVSSQQSAVGSQQSAVGSQQSAVGSQQSAVGSQQNEPVAPATALTKTPEPGTQNPESGTHLFQLAREAYDGNPFLWVLIYRANLDKISNPDQVVMGRDLVIPALEGTPKKLTRNDSLAVSDGYRLVYEYYLDHGNPKAEEFRLVMLKYKQE